MTVVALMVCAVVLPVAVSAHKPVKRAGTVVTSRQLQCHPFVAAKPSAPRKVIDQVPTPVTPDTKLPIAAPPKVELELEPLSVNFVPPLNSVAALTTPPFPSALLSSKVTVIPAAAPFMVGPEDQ